MYTDWSGSGRWPVGSSCEQRYKIQGVSNMTGTNCDLFTHNQSRSYLNHLVQSYGILTFF
jgi:hypothetical protein